MTFGHEGGGAFNEDQRGGHAGASKRVSLKEARRIALAQLEKADDCDDLIEERDIAEAAADEMASLVLGEPINWPCHDDAWRRAVLTLRMRKQAETLTPKKGN